MRLVVTGGGTGGHVFPALEVATAAREQGWACRYVGSQRGQERTACERVGIPFQGFPSEPVYRVYTPRGVRAALNLLRATGAVGRNLAKDRPDVVFATGGYAAAPVVSAARRLRIPYVLHEQNSVPGRTNRIWSRQAAAVCTVFHHAEGQFPRARTVRTGMPVRQAFRLRPQTDLGIDPDRSLVLVVGGSQGSAALNDVALACGVRMAGAGLQWLHLTGKAHFESTTFSAGRLGLNGEYRIRPYLDAPEMAAAVHACVLAVGRSGAGTLAELAALRKPSVLVPYPFAFGQHQLANAREFADQGAATIVEQSDLTAATLAEAVEGWLSDHGRVARAEAALAEWDVPDAVARIIGRLAAAARPTVTA